MAALSELLEHLHLSAVRELIQLDVYHRRKRGEAPNIQDYVVRFSDLDPDWLAGAMEAVENPVAAPTLAGTSSRTQEIQTSSRVEYFGDYELLGEIARGGMGVAYQARQATLDRIVALKMVRVGKFATPREARRFRQEVEAVAALDHPNIVPIYEVGEHHGRQYYTMRLLGGGSLAARVAEFAVTGAGNRADARIRQSALARLVGRFASTMPSRNRANSF